MKQLLTILLLFPLFIACSSDDDNNHGDTLEEQIVGTWVLKDDPVFKPITKLVFNKDKTCSIIDEDGKVTDSKYTIYAGSVVFLDYWKAKVDNNILTVTSTAIPGELVFKRK